MSTQGDNNAWPPDGGRPDRLPELPPDWAVVIPDDAAELAAEAEVVRAELRAEREIAIIGARRGLGGALRAPFAIVAVALIVTLASIFAATGTGPARPGGAQRNSTTAQGRGVPALELIDDYGKQIALRGQRPAVILLVDGCVCDQLIAETVRAVRPGISILAVSSTAPPSAAARPAGAPPVVPAVRHLHDPAGELRRSLSFSPPDGTAAAVLVAGSGQIALIVGHTLSVNDFRSDLARLV